jgi:hypothetical protein
MHASAITRLARRLLPLLGLVLAACGDDDPPGPSLTDVRLTLEPVVSGLVGPVHLAAPVGDTRLFIVEKPGRIRIVRDGQLLPTPFLDITGRVSSDGERGLLSVAFPRTSVGEHFFVYYTNRNGDIVVERFTAALNADVANPATGVPVITIPHPRHSNHNGGMVAFGPDGMLWLATGDGGGAGDPDANAQNLGSLLGKILRLDVRTLPYAIPPSNPFVGQAGKRGEIWAYGLRNPWRFAFVTGLEGAPARLFVADVGQGAVEEIDFVRADSAGINYGWPIMEGDQCYPPASGCIGAGLLRPVAQYGHDRGCSIVGGYVYTGGIEGLPWGRHYFYSDYCSGFLESLTHDGNAWTRHVWNVPDVGHVLGFGERGGELYVLAESGTVYRIVERTE